jgi:TonB family protein
MRVRLTTWLGVLTLVVALPALATAQEQLRVGGTIAEPKKIRDVKPAYPPVAQQAGVEGVVILEAIVGTDGAVRSARVLRGQPLLDEAAIGAVQQWRYTPTLLNGVPVEVVMTVTVNFSLSGGAATVPAYAGNDMTRLGGQVTPQFQAEVVDGFPDAVRVGGDVKEPRKIRDVAPNYPDIARAAKVQGIVILELVIDVSGRVAATKVLRGVALLDQAAVDAVSQWEYEPTFLNSVATPVRMTVTVNFTLN